MDAMDATVDRPRSRLSPWTLIIGATLVASTLVFAFTGELAFAIAPVLLVVALAALLKAPAHVRAIGLFFAVIFLDDPKAQPAEHRWKHIFSPIGAVLMDNLNNVTGVSALSF